MIGDAKDILSKVEIDEKEDFSPRQIEQFKTDQDFYRTFVKAIEKEINGNFSIVRTWSLLLNETWLKTDEIQIQRDSPMQAFAVQQVTEYMRATLEGDERLCKALIPTFELGCRRMTPGHGYLKALTAPNVTVVTEGMKRVVPEGIELESGELLHLDAIICATGFDTSFCPRFPLHGRNGNLQDLWRNEKPKAYMSCAVAGMPNYFSNALHLPTYPPVYRDYTY